MTLQVIVFSKDRPLQLHGYLSSLYGLTVDPARLKVSVLARVGSEYADAYSQVVTSFPGLTVCYEQDFATQLPTLIKEVPFTMFGCDDVVFTDWLDILGLETKLDESDALGLSLRLGKHTTRDMFGNLMPQPKFERDNSWGIDGSVMDWGYPWEVLGTIYPTDYVQRMVAKISPRSPSELEFKGSLCWRTETDLRRLVCREEASLVVPTVNVVQREYPNGIKGETLLDPEFLLDCWRHGLRLDWQRYFQATPESWRIPEFFLARI